MGAESELSRAVPAEVRPYLRELVRRTRAVCGPRLTGVVAVGSLALGDYRNGRSDIDVTVVVEGSPDTKVLRENWRTSSITGGCRARRRDWNWSSTRRTSPVPPPGRPGSCWISTRALSCPAGPPSTRPGHRHSGTSSTAPWPIRTASRCTGRPHRR
ncbi:nucleotidyltransferase domain-containing protein [Streptomyces sp. NRRL F-5630]|uniref:nucleotidyltransferase domain-containing protein n=1 Tax=Streptomyces sp. NRRL F-5630 TaxID=1463864 RepID=UPI003D734E13